MAVLRRRDLRRVVSLERDFAEVDAMNWDKWLKEFESANGISAIETSDLRFAYESGLKQAMLVIGPSGDRLQDFRADQWWLPELEVAVAGGTDDQKRALAVVKNMLDTVNSVIEASNGSYEAGQRDMRERAASLSDDLFNRARDGSEIAEAIRAIKLESEQ